MINDKKLHDLITEAAKKKQNEIIEAINNRMVKMANKKKRLALQATKGKSFVENKYGSFMSNKTPQRRVSDMKYMDEIKSGSLILKNLD